jgi:hypothetical protein
MGSCAFYTHKFILRKVKTAWIVNIADSLGYETFDTNLPDY